MTSRYDVSGVVSNFSNSQFESVQKCRKCSRSLDNVNFRPISKTKIITKEREQNLIYALLIPNKNFCYPTIIDKTHSFNVQTVPFLIERLLPCTSLVVCLISKIVDSRVLRPGRVQVGRHETFANVWHPNTITWLHGSCFLTTCWNVAPNYAKRRKMKMVRRTEAVQIGKIGTS